MKLAAKWLRQGHRSRLQRITTVLQEDFYQAIVHKRELEAKQAMESSRSGLHALL